MVKIGYRSWEGEGDEPTTVQGSPLKAKFRELDRKRMKLRVWLQGSAVFVG